MTTAKTATARFPFIITVNGVRFFATSKEGVRICNGLRSAEYADNDDRRVWLDSAGNVYED